MALSRKDYIDGIVSHDEYYGQFVTDALMEYVCNIIGRQLINKSTDKSFNNIALSRWDAIAPYIITQNKAIFEEFGETPTLSTGVCIAKSAAKQIRGF